jgi:hypothetical protein
MHDSPIALNLIIPTSVESQVVIAVITEELDDLIQSYRRVLRGPGSNGITQFILRSCLSPSEIYEFFLTTWQRSAIVGDLRRRPLTVQ